MSRPVVLAPASPAELLTALLAHHAHPTTLIVGGPRAAFAGALARAPADALLRAPLGQRAVAQRLRVAFVPTVAHLRAYLATLAAPGPGPDAAPLLLVYGFVALHRGGSEWAAQGLGASAAVLVESAARVGLRAAIAEPAADGPGALAEPVPLLRGAAVRDDGAWSGRTVAVRAVLGRWFEFAQETGP